MDSNLLTLLWMLWNAPLSSYSDLNRWELLTEAQLRDAIEKGKPGRYPLITGGRMGRIFMVQERFLLTSHGVRAVIDELGMELERQVTERYVATMVSRLSMMEAFNHVLPGLFQSEAIRLPAVFHPHPGPDAPELKLDNTTRLVRILRPRSQRDMRLHLVAQYRTAQLCDVFIPVIFIGSHGGVENLPGDLEETLAYLETEGPHWYGHHAIRPPGVLIIARDRFAALKARWEFASSIPRAIVTETGAVIDQMLPQCPNGYVLGTAERVERLGNPERTMETALADKTFLALNGVPNFYLFNTIELFPALDVSNLAIAIGQSRQETVAMRKEQEEEELVRMDRREHYPAAKAIGVVANRDGLNWNTARGAMGQYPDPANAEVRRQKGHDRMVGRIAVHAKRSGYAVAQGRLKVVNYEEGPRGARATQLKPDLWVLVHFGNGMGMWYLVEAERYATYPGQMEDKLKPQLIARDEHGETWPYLLIVGKDRGGNMDEESRAARFLEHVRDLPVMIATLSEVRDGRAFGGESVWRYGNRRVDIRHRMELGRPDLEMVVPRRDGRSPTSGSRGDFSPDDSTVGH